MVLGELGNLLQSQVSQPLLSNFLLPFWQSEEHLMAGHTLRGLGSVMKRARCESIISKDTSAISLLF